MKIGQENDKKEMVAAEEKKKSDRGVALKIAALTVISSVWAIVSWHAILLSILGCRALARKIIFLGKSNHNPLEIKFPMQPKPNQRENIK